LLFLAGFAITAVLLGFATDLRRNFKLLSTANSDNVLWVLSQAEIEVANLENTLALELLKEDPNLDKIRLKYDILYSRNDTIMVSPAYIKLREEPRLAPSVQALDKFVAEHVDLVDGSDEALIAALPMFLEHATAIRQQVRGMAATAVQSISVSAANQLESLILTIVRLIMLLAALVIVFLVALVTVIQLNRALRKSALAQSLIRDRMESIVTTSLDAVIVTNREGIILEYNDAAAQMFQYSQEEAIGHDLSDLIIPEKYKAAHVNGMARYRKKGTKRVIGQGIVQLEGQRKDGSIIPVDLTLSTAMTETGEIFVSFLRNISDRVANETELREARDRAIAGERSKAELLAVMSHEMRTPLNGMLGTLELINFDDLPAKHRRYLRIIRKSGQLLLNHVNDVLDISRLDVGKVPLVRQQFDLIELLEEIIASQMGAASEHNTKLVLTPPRPELHEAYSDPTRLQQVLLNLLGNAVKFTHNGQITIETECLDGLDEVMIRIIDTGIGIPEEEQERIFGDFETIDTTYSRNNTGTGLGLGISKRLITLLDGNIGVESDPGEGSVFWISLPLAAPEGLDPAVTPEPELPEAAGNLPPLDVLVVEDNEINRLVARSMLELDGHHVTEANDGQAGVTAANAKKFDVILMDISMPEMDGLQATQAIRASDGASSEAPVIATTAHALAHEVEKFRAAGMTDILSKPLTRGTVRSVLSNAVQPELGKTNWPTSFETHAHVLIDESRLVDLKKELSPAVLRPTFARFTAETTTFLRDLPDQAGPATQRIALAQQAHKLAGSAAVFGALEFRNLLNQLETEIETASEEDYEAMLQRLKSTWNATRTELNTDPALAL
jgi:PAS domain S-box-containing protein